MKIDIYHLYKHFEYSNFVYPIVLDVLKVWAEEAGAKATVYVCREEEVRYNTDADVIALSVYTQTAPASYRVSSRMRQLGKVVILGGPHFRNSTCGEAVTQCDVVVSTVCQAQWTRLLEDIDAGRLGPNRDRAIVVSDTYSEFDYPENFYEAFKSQKWYQIPSVPTSIGCPYDCAFCSAFLQGRYKLRSLDSIFNELQHTPRKVVFLCDATFGLNKRFTIELMNRIGPLRKRILVETALARLTDRDLLDALAKGGISWVSVGIESLAIRLRKHGRADLEENLERVINELHERGILVQANFICGMDSDGPESFQRIFEFYQRSKVDLILIDLLTPYPNTPQHDSLLADGRIIDFDWEHYDYRHVVYRPKLMTPDQLIDGFIQLYRSITRPSFVLHKGSQIFREVGFTLEALLMASYNAFSRFDAHRKEGSLKENRKEILKNASTRPGASDYRLSLL